MKYRLFALQEPLLRLELIGDMVAPVEPAPRPSASPPGGSSPKPPANS
jgi:hypothetical protein